MKFRVTPGFSTKTVLKYSKNRSSRIPKKAENEAANEAENEAENGAENEGENEAGNEAGNEAENGAFGDHTWRSRSTITLDAHA